MIRHDTLGHVHVDPATGVTTLDGRLLTIPPADTVPLARLYFL